MARSICAALLRLLIASLIAICSSSCLEKQAANNPNIATSIAVPSDSEEAQLLEARLDLFDGKYPEGWPAGLRLPANCYIENNGSITIRSAGEESPVPSFSVTGIACQPYHDTYAEIVKSCPYKIYNGKERKEDESNTLILPLKEGGYSALYIRADALSYNQGWSWFTVRIK